jgi:hypothetical protein
MYYKVTDKIVVLMEKNMQLIFIYDSFILNIVVTFVSFADMDPKQLVTGREKRELIIEEAGKDPVCGILSRNIEL